jgi:hypothetical protein
MNKIITRIKGGLGNQLFCYAAARRLALVNNAELVIDDVTGFARDRLFQQQFALDKFSIPARKATPAERLEPFERWRRGLMKWVSRRRSFTQLTYLEQEGNDFDDRLPALQVKGTLYLDGYWQGEDYFKDVEKTIRKDLRITPPTDVLNQRMADEIRNCLAVALHVRWFEVSGSCVPHNISADYYRRAIALMDKNLSNPCYFVFSDDVEAARDKLALPKDRVTFVSHNRGDENAYADMWLMGQCQHFITANSTFSWWGAWLGGGKNKIVVTPDVKIVGIGAWGFKGLIPNEWVRV